jgi:hypothetical protein
MVDFLELSMRKVVKDNAIYCANKVGYFNPTT